MRPLVAFCLLDRKNKPIMMFNKGPMSDSAINKLFYAVLDSVDEKVLKNKTYEPYLGLLYALEDMSVYAYRTSTNYKFLVAYRVNTMEKSTIIRDSEMKLAFEQCHREFLRMVIMDPFYDIDGSQLIQSSLLSSTINSILDIEVSNA